jgi:nucleotide-binding universal stress UspA family protein
VITRILVALDDSQAALTAARLATALADQLGARLRMVHVAVDHELGEAVRRVSGEPDVQARIVHGRHALLERASRVASETGVGVETVMLVGDVAPALLAEAEVWDADLVVLGRSTRSAHGVPYVGSQARQVLEFTTRPVIIVPSADLPVP